MKVRIETVGDFKSGMGHFHRMNALGMELVEKYKANVYIADAEAEVDPDVDLVIVDSDTYEDTYARVMQTQQTLPQAKIIVFRNGSDWDDFDVDYTVIPKWANVILHPAFRGPIDSGFNKEVNTITVFQGGSDPYGLAPRILGALDVLFVRTRILVVIGPAVSDLTMTALQHFNRCTRLMNVSYLYNVDQPSIAEVYKNTDIAFMPPGQSFAEATACHCPCVIIGHHGRHFEVGEKLKKKGAVMHLGIGTMMDDLAMLGGVKMALDKMASPSVRAGYVSKALKVVKPNGIDKIMEVVKGVMNAT